MTDRQAFKTLKNTVTFDTDCAKVGITRTSGMG